MKKLFFILTLTLFLVMSCSDDSTSPTYQLHTPTNLQITQLDVMRFQLNWVDESSNEQGYKIERKIDDGYWSEVAQLAEDSSEFIDTLETRNTWETVYYQVYSFYADNTSDAAEINSTIQFDAPSDLVVTQTANQFAELNWYDNSFGEQGFKIERKTNVNYNFLASVDANVSSFVDSNIVVGTYNHYRVYAYAGGNNTGYTNEDSLIVFEGMHAEFTADPLEGYAPLMVEFTDLSSGDILEWEWDFGDGETSDDQNPVHVYDNPGTYTVKLTISNNDESDVETKVDYINVDEEVGNVMSDYFESYADFSISFSPWTLVDLDGSETYGIQGVSWTNVYDPQAFIVFNPTATIPPVVNAPAYSGEKYAACFSSTAPPNNDWMITPEVELTGEEDLMFMAKSYTDQYGLERFEVGISTTNPAPGEFTIISSAPYEEAPAAAWTEFSYGLQDYTGTVYIGIHCVSYDAWFLMIDDIIIGNPHDAGSEPMKIDFESGNYLRSSR